MDRNDLISREALKETIISICGNCSNIIREYKEGVPDGNCAIQHIMNMIDNAPTVKTYCYFCGQTEHGQIEEKPQGEWIDQDFDDLKISDYRCNQCGHYQDDITNFCPNCGAKMSNSV